MADSDYRQQGWGEFCPLAVLSAGVGPLDDTIPIGPIEADDGDEIAPGIAALIGDEIVRVTEVGEGYVKVGRGCGDTIPAAHPAGTVIWFIDDSIGTDEIQYRANDEITVKVITNTTSGVLPISEAPPNELEMNYRLYRPYPPGKMQANGEPWFTGQVLSSDEPALTLSWAHRDRLAQADQLIDHLEDNIGPEPGTTYFARIFKAGETAPRRTEVGLNATSWSYLWSQAMSDFELDPDLIGGGLDVNGYIEFGSHRGPVNSWQVYTIPFTINTRGMSIMLAQMSMRTASVGEDWGEAGRGVTIGQVGNMVMTDADDAYQGAATGVMVAGATMGAGQETSLPTTFVRELFEAPYTYNLRREGVNPLVARVVSTVARPSDRLTDQQMMYSRLGDQSTFAYRKTGVFTPWATLAHDLDYLEKEVSFETTSLFDGVPLDGVLPGQMALIGTEIVRVDSISMNGATFARGCADTRPFYHRKGTRVWFFEAYSLVDTTPWPTPAPGGVVLTQYKTVPVVYGPPVPLDRMPTDELELAARKDRPFPPGDVKINGKPWYMGATATPDEPIVITWNQRNRITQGVTVVDHEHGDVPHEANTRYLLELAVWVPGADHKPVKVVIRQAWVTGRRFDYTWEMAAADGPRIAGLLDKCGHVSAVMMLYAVRVDSGEWGRYLTKGLFSWQGYPLPLILPAPACPPGRYPGGGMGGGSGGPGSGEWVPPPPQPGGGNGGIGPSDPRPPDDDPLENNKPDPLPDPEPPPPDWPDPIEPPIEPPPPPPAPPGNGYWDIAWDHFWAAYGRGDDPGD